MALNLASIAFGGWFDEAETLNPFSAPTADATEVVWPVDLPDLMVGATDMTTPAVVRSEMDVGPPKVRRRATKEQRRLRTSLSVNGSQRVVFEAFRRNVWATGERFQWEDALGDTTVICRVVAWPEWQLVVASPNPAERIWEGSLDVEVVG